MKKTVLIAFEGIDGSGKTVQMRLLEQRLKQRGLTVDTLEFPVYDSFFGQEIGKLLTAREGVGADQVDAKSMALWFAMDRFQALRNYRFETDVLLLNRYVLSNAVYQSIRERDTMDLLPFVMELEHRVLGLPEADAYLYLDVNTKQAGENVLQKGYRAYVGGESEKDVYEAKPNIQLRARDQYLAYAKKRKDIHVIPCMRDGVLKPEQEISNEVYQLLLDQGIIRLS